MPELDAETLPDLLARKHGDLSPENVEFCSPSSGRASMSGDCLDQKITIPHAWMWVGRSIAP